MIKTHNTECLHRMSIGIKLVLVHHRGHINEDHRGHSHVISYIAIMLEI